MSHTSKQVFLHSHGACGEVTGSKHFVRLPSGMDLLVDCGMFQGHRAEAYRRNSQWTFPVEQVGAVILTHAHFDHSGALPILVRKGFSGPIFATPATRDIARVILSDSAHIQQKDYEYLLAKKEEHPERNIMPREPLYDMDDVEATMALFQPVSYGQPFEPAPGCRATLWDAGHILGSAMVSLELEDRGTIGFSGDLGRSGLPIIRDPQVMPPLDWLVLESTYGNRLHGEVGDIGRELAGAVLEICRRKGRMVVPAFTIERTQELLYILHRLMEEKSIPRIPVYVDSPMAVNATRIFSAHKDCFDLETFQDFLSRGEDPFGFDSVRYVTRVEDSRAINDQPGPLIVLSASGMAESGRILHHLKNTIEDARNMVTVVGYMAAHTLGRRVVDGAGEVSILGKLHAVGCEIRVLSGFSGHADYREMEAWLDRQDLGRLRRVHLVHGEPEALVAWQSRLKSRLQVDVQVVEEGRAYPLDAGVPGS